MKITLGVLGVMTYTVEHFMIKYIDTLHIRDTYLSVNNMQTLFCDVSPDIVIEYVKEIGMYYEISFICNLTLLTTDNRLLISIKQYYDHT